VTGHVSYRRCCLSLTRQSAWIWNITPCVIFTSLCGLKLNKWQWLSWLSLDVVCRLNVFHMIMSFLRSIGTVVSLKSRRGSGMLQQPNCSCTNDERQEHFEDISWPTEHCGSCSCGHCWMWMPCHMLTRWHMLIFLSCVLFTTTWWHITCNWLTHCHLAWLNWTRLLLITREY